MAPVSRFRKPEWQHRDADRRARAVATGDDPELVDALPRIAAEDPAPEVRRAAMERLDDWRSLAELIAAEGDEATARAVTDRALSLLRQDPDAEPGAAAALVERASETTRSALLREAQSARLRASLVAECTDPALLADRALKDPERSIRERALEQLDDPEQLARVVKHARGRDKRLWRRADAKLEELRVSAGDPEACARRAERLVASLEAMARGSDDGAASRQALESEWQALPESAREPYRRRFEGVTRILDKAAAPRPEPAPEPAEESPEESPPAPSMPPALTEIAREAELLAEQEQPSRDAADDLERRWRETWDPGLEGQPEADALHQRLRGALDRARSRRDQVEKAHDRQRETIERHLSALEEHLASGDLHEAREADHHIKQVQRDGQARPSKSQDRRLAKAHRELHELRDWQHWANNRVRQRLCEEVEALPESDLHPDALLEALKRAQKEWRELEDSEKLSGETRTYRASGPGLWKRFQAAGKRAFEHARPFLEKRTELRHQKLEAVRALIAELEELASAEETGDPRKLAGKLSEARRSLSRLGELPPPDRGPTARALRSLLDELGKRLDETREALARDKRALIAEAEALDPESGLDRAISGAKSIMARWKKLDTLPRGRERRLWSELRRHLDPIFEKRDADQAAVREQQAEEQRDLESLCDEAERLADLPGAELDQATSDLNRLRGQWQQHARRPRALDQRFRRALDTFRHRLAEHRAAQRFERIRNVFDCARICRRVDAGELDREDAIARWPEPQALPDGTRERLAARRDGAGEAPGSSTDANLKFARGCVLTMELLSGVPSPSEDEDARMELKVSRLNQAMRGEREELEAEEEMEALLADWAATGPVPADEADALESRVAAALEAFYGQKLNAG